MQDHPDELRFTKATSPRPSPHRYKIYRRAFGPLADFSVIGDAIAIEALIQLG
ncbi:hypothetical protein JNB91_00885 [Rhizobium wenxiniae]|nr:hypothetical protein [Rhizobium wenxiniae]